MPSVESPQSPLSTTSQPSPALWGDLSALSSDDSDIGTDSPTQLWQYQSSGTPTDVSTEGIGTITPTLQEDESAGPILFNTISPSLLSKPAEDLSLPSAIDNEVHSEVPAYERRLPDASMPLPSSIEAGDQVTGVLDTGACMPLLEFGVVQAPGSYDQGSMEESSFDITDLKSCGSAISSGGASKLYYVVGPGAVLTAHTCSQFLKVMASKRSSPYTSNMAGVDIPCARDLRCVGSNDDFCGKHSLVTWFAEESRSYFIHVHSKGFDFDSVHHPFSLTLSPTPGGSCQSAISLRPDSLTGVLELGSDPSGMNLLEVVGFVWFLVPESEFSWPIRTINLSGKKFRSDWHVCL